MPDDVYQPYASQASPFRPGPGGPTYAPYGGLPLGQLGQLLAPLLLPQTGSGQFNYGYNPGSNLAFNMDSQARTQAYYDALRRAAARDAPLLPTLGQTYAAIRGYQWTPEMQNNAQRISGALTDPASAYNIGPFASAFLPQIDTLSGGTSQMPLTHQLMRMDRWRPQNVDAISQSYFDFYAKDSSGKFSPGGMRQRAHGFTLGEIGTIATEMSISGQLPSMSGNQEESLKRLTRNTDEYAKTLGYLRDIFVGQGRKAPIEQIMTTLEQLSGGMQQLDPAKAGRMLTQFNQASRSLDYNLDTAVTVAQIASAQAQAAGINQAFAMPVASEAMMFRADVQAGGIPRAWRMSTADQMTLRYQAQTAAAAGSEFGNRLGMMSRMAERYGVSIAALDAARTGDVGNDAYRRAVLGSEEGFLQEMAKATGRPVEEMRNVLRSRLANEEALYNNDLLGAAKGAQNIEFYDRIRREGRAEFTIGGELAARIGRGEGAASLSGRLGGWLLKTMEGMSAGDIGNRDIRNAYFADAAKQLRAAAAGKGPEAEAARNLLRNWESRGLDVEKEATRLMSDTFDRLNQDHFDRTGITLEDQAQTLQRSREEALKSRRAENRVRAEADRLGSGAIIPGMGWEGLVGRTMEQLLRMRDGGPGSPTSMTEAAAQVFGLDVTSQQAQRIGEMATTMASQGQAIAEKRDKARIAALKSFGEDDPRRKTELERIEQTYAADLKAYQDKQASFEKFLAAEEQAKLREKLGLAEESKTGEGGGSLNLSGVTININGEPILKDGKGEGTVRSRARGEAPTP